MMNISKRMLNNTATYYKFTGIDLDRQKTYGDAITLRHVWITASLVQAEDGNGKTPRDKMTMYYDVINSTANNGTNYVNVTFSKGDKITYAGEDYEINTINSCHGLKGLEHFELGLN